MRKDYVIPSVAGRLGNNLFMVANAYTQARKYGKELYLYRNHFIYENSDYTKNILKSFNFIDHFDDSGIHNPVVPSDDKHSIYVGYFQSEKYFSEFSNDVVNIFGPDQEFVERIREKFPILFSDRICSINVRRGDYLHYPDYHPVVSSEYLRKCIDLIGPKHCMVFSDDIEWCKTNIDFENCVYVEGYPPHEQLWIMSLCHDFIISNSSFSWWGAYLSKNPDKRVISPSIWFGPRFEGDWGDMYCEGWEILDCFYSDGKILPK